MNEGEPLRSLLLGVAAAGLLAAGCSSGEPDTPAGPGPAAAVVVTTTAAPTTTAGKPPAQPARRVPLCPKNPATNGALSDQGEQIGTVGRTSHTYATDAGDLAYCIAVTAARRAGAEVVVTVRLINHGKAPADTDGEDQIRVSLAYGPDGVVAGAGVLGEPLAGVVHPGRSLTGTYSFEVPRDQTAVTVTAGPAFGSDPGAWVGKVPTG